MWSTCQENAVIAECDLRMNITISLNAILSRGKKSNQMMEGLTGAPYVLCLSEQIIKTFAITEDMTRDGTSVWIKLRRNRQCMQEKH